jgi:hypothetical protein
MYHAIVKRIALHGIQQIECSLSVRCTASDCSDHGVEPIPILDTSMVLPVISRIRRCSGVWASNHCQIATSSPHWLCVPTR